MRIPPVSVSRFGCIRPLFGVGVLLKFDDLTTAQTPHMRELSVNKLAGGLHFPTVSPFDNDGVSALDEVFRYGGDVLDVGCDTSKEA